MAYSWEQRRPLSIPKHTLLAIRHMLFSSDEIRGTLHGRRTKKGLLRALSLLSGAVLLARPTPRLPCIRRRAYLQATTAGYSWIYNEDCSLSRSVEQDERLNKCRILK